MRPAMIRGLEVPECRPVRVGAPGTDEDGADGRVRGAVGRKRGSETGRAILARGKLVGEGKTSRGRTQRKRRAMRRESYRARVRW